MDVKEGAVIKIKDKRIILKEYRNRLGVLKSRRSGHLHKVLIPSVGFEGEVHTSDFELISVCGKHLGSMVYHDNQEEFFCPFCEEI